MTTQNQNQPCYIALNGLPESGKTEVAKWLIEHHGFTRIGFGDHIKSAAMLIYSLSHDQAYGELKDVVDLRYGITPRFILKQLGTEVCRAIHPDTWVFPVKEVLDWRPNRIVIDDLRFPNEVPMLLNYGAVLIHIERPGHIPSDRLGDPCYCLICSHDGLPSTCDCECNGLGLRLHQSNWPLQTKFDLTISNDSDIPALHFKLKTLAQILKL